MTYPVQRAALILLAGSALSLCALPAAAQAQAPAVVGAPAVDQAPVLALPAPGVDAAAHARSRHHRAAAQEEAQPTTYKVKKGDTLEKIAPKLGTDIETLVKLNGLKKPYRLQPGQVLKGPAAEAPAKSKSAGKGKAARAEAETYTVKKGDTLFSIAKAHGITVEQLKALNHLGKKNAISGGQKLKVSGETADAADEATAPEPKSRRRGEAAEAGASDGAAGRVTEVAGAGKSYRVRRGDTPEKVARKLGVSVEELARINHLKRPVHVRAGQTLRGAGGATSRVYVVARGDTLAGIARRFGVSEAELKAANGLKRRVSAVPAGRKLHLPAGAREPSREPQREYQPPRYTPPTNGVQPPVRPTPGMPSQPQPYSGSATPGGSITGAPQASGPIPDAQISQLGRGLFAWPIKGTVIAGFGDRGNGQRNDGLDIRANAGDPVRAAAAGNVVYAGDQVPGFGNLVLIQHADGWVTAYGHLGKVDVRMQQKVSQGQQIGEAGTSGGVSEPQLHFEVRYKPSPDDRARPVDPNLVLPK